MEFGVCFTSPATPSLPLPPNPTGQFTVVLRRQFFRDLDSDFLQYFVAQFAGCALVVSLSILEGDFVRR